MLKDAALLHLKLMLAALDAGMILKDSSAYNIQWNGAAPVFIDIPSFEVLAQGEPWIGYRQFCELFLYPLMLQAYKGVDYRPWLRGSIDGIPAEAMKQLLSSARLSSRRRAAPCRRAGGAAEAIFRRQRARQARAGGLRQEPDRQQRRQAAEDRLSHAAGRRQDDLGRLRAIALLRSGGVRGEARLRHARRRLAALEARMGYRLQHRHVLAHRRRARRLGRRDGRRLDGGRKPLSRAAVAAGPREKSCRWS